MKKIALLLIVLTGAFGALGVGYAIWFDTITFNGNVTTGSVCWRFSSCSVLDPIPPPPYFPVPSYMADYTTNNGFVPDPVTGAEFWHLDKNVSSGECAIDYPNPGNPQGNSHTLTVSLHNTYPSNFNSISFYIFNCGTIPINVWKLEVLDNTGKVIGTFYQTFYTALDLSGDGQPDVEIKYMDNFGAQIEPGPGGKEFSFWVHTLQPAPQNTDLKFQFRIYAVQWNEYSPSLK